MIVSRTLAVYLVRQSLFWLGCVLLALTAVIFLFDSLELLRRSADRDAVTIEILLGMAVMRLPNLVAKVLPYAVLIGAIVAFWRLNRHFELVAARSSGVSAWQILLPALGLAAAVGVFKVAVFNPVAAAMQLRYERLEAAYLADRPSLVALSDAGLWLRQNTDGGHFILHAREVSSPDLTLRRVTVFLLRGADRFVRRIDAPAARLHPGFWVLDDARITGPRERPRTVEHYGIPTDLTLDNVLDSFAPADTVSFWALPAFIDVLARAGLPAGRHLLAWHTQLATPFLLCAMVLLAAAFALRPARARGAAILIGAGVAAGFLIHFSSDIVSALAVSERLPVVVAAWTPAAICGLVGSALVFHLEDG